MKKINLSNYKNIEINFPEKEKIFCDLKNILKSDSIVTIGVSGGPDSIFTCVLIYKFFIENNFKTDNIFFLHCNHKIRKESENEQKFVESFFKGFNFKVFARPKSDTDKLTEAGLRQRRYKCFENIIQKTQSDFLVLGHNLTDRIETSFLNLSRGASLNGFVSMKFYEAKKTNSNYNISRPVLGLTKKNIENLCKKFKIPFVVDLSNLDSQTSKRNYLRNEVLPLVFKLSNRQDDDTNSFVESMSKIYGEIENLISEKKTKKNSKKKHILSLKKIKLSKFCLINWSYELETDRTKLQSDDLVSLLKDLKIYSDIGESFLTQLLKFLRENTDGYKYFNGTYFFVSHGKIYLINGEKLFWEKQIDKEIQPPNSRGQVKKIGKISFGDFKLDVQNNLWIGAKIRFPKQKDVYKGKNLKKYLLNKKIPVFWRNFVPVLEKNGKILQVFWNSNLKT